MISIWLAVGETVTQKTPAFLYAPPPWVIFLILAPAILAFVWLCYRSERGSSSRPAKIAMGSLRLLILTTLLLILFDPVIKETTSQVQKSHILVLVDESRSMKTKDRYTEEESAQLLKALSDPPEMHGSSEIERSQIVNRLLSSSTALAELKEKAVVRFFSFSSNLKSLEKWEEIQPNGQFTNIHDHLIEAIDTLKGRTISALILLTDGQHNQGKHTWEEAAEYASQKHDIPIYPIGIGSDKAKKDVILSVLDADEVALVDDKVPFVLEIRHVGYEGLEIPIHLKEGTRFLEEKYIKLGPEDKRQEVTIHHAFPTPGEKTITATIPLQDEEFTEENNTLTHQLKVIEEKFRVLYLEGLPRWEYRYLINALKRDHTVIVNSWLYSADPQFPQEKSKEAPEITGFPNQEELAKYHCVILGDVSPDHLTQEQMKNLVHFVEELGGGVVFIPGVQYNPYAYVDTPLFPLLPVVLDDPEMGGEFNREMRMELTSEGKIHPLMQLETNAAESLTLWESDSHGLPGFYWYVPVKKPKPGATVLAKHRDNRRVLMATQFCSAGRSFFTALDESWRWRFLKGDLYFYRFWGSVIRHVSMGILLNNSMRYALRVDNLRYDLGQMVTVILRVLDARKQPVSQENWKVEYRLPSGEVKEKVLQAQANKLGSYEGTIVATEIGGYKVWIKSDEGKEVNALFQVIAPTTESGKTQLDEVLLKNIAQKTNGAYLKPYEFETLAQRIPIKMEPIPDSHDEYPLWDHYGYLLLIIGLFTLEWIGRKLARLL